MNVFVLNTGRCGSSTFIKSCQHIRNYSCAHESLSEALGAQRFNFPKDHIEADNRLSWLLGRLDDAYGDDAFYVHLKRNHSDTTTSFSKRIDFGILKTYEQGVLMHDKHQVSADLVAGDYIETVDANINLFLKDKKNKMDVSLESIKTDFTAFWQRINAQGDLAKAIKEWDTNYNAS